MGRIETLKGNLAPVIAVFGHYGQKNLGDEAIITAVLQNVRARLPAVRLVGLSLDPWDTQGRHGIRSAPIRREITQIPDRPPESHGGRVDQGVVQAISRWLKRRALWLYRVLRWCLDALAMTGNAVAEVSHWWKSFRLLRGTDLMIIAGSNQIMDFFGGVRGFPLTLLKWTLLARLVGARVAFLSVGANPLASASSRSMYRLALGMAHHVSVRDRGSQSIVAELVPAINPEVTPDLAFSLQVPVKSDLPVPVGTARASGTVGVSLMPIFDPRYWPEADPVKYRRYVEVHAELIRHLVLCGRSVAVFGSQPADEWVAEDVLQRLDGIADINSHVTLVRARAVDQLLEVIDSCELVVATRFHCILLSLRCRKPVLGVNYYKKNRELLESFRLSRFSVEPDELATDKLISLFEELWRERQRYASEIDQVNRQFESHLARQYDELLTSCIGDFSAQGKSGRSV